MDCKMMKEKRICRPISMMVVAFVCFCGLLAPTQAAGRRFRDTVHFKISLAEKKALVLSDSVLNEIGIDSLLGKIENVHITLDRINNATATGFDTREIEGTLPELDSNIDIIDDNVLLYSSVLDVKNLQMFYVLLGTLQTQIAESREVVFRYDKELGAMNAELALFKRDTILKALLHDSAFVALYSNEIADLKTKWKAAKKAIADNLTNVDHLQATLSNEYFTTIDLQNKIKDLFKKSQGKILGKEYDYLWEVKTIAAADEEKNNELAHKSYIGQIKILKYYFRRNVSDQIWLLVIGVLFLLWVFRNYRIFGKLTQGNNAPGRSFKYITKYSLLPTLVLLLNIAPFFDLHPPTAYIEIMELLLVVSLTFLLWRDWPRRLYFFWIIIGVLYFIFSTVGPILTPALSSRILLLTLNIVSVIFGIIWFRTLSKYTLVFSKMIRIVSILFLLLNLTAIFCNLYGRLSYAKIFSVTAIYSLTQIIGLSVFIQVFIEAFHLQNLINKAKGGFVSKLNFQRMEILLTRALTLISIVIWCIVFSISLNIYNLLFRKIQMFLTAPRVIGNNTFEIGNILLFIVIIYISNLLQQGIGSLYGRAETDWDPEVKKNGSRLAMTRLIFIVMGFLIAVAASGLPMDKITIVLGALGVGIGLGLQTIVNNLVSGVILIFEQPFRIGDFIELGDMKGRVLDIGIRSSKLVMEEGAEVIMPNADLLSGRVVNWTLRNDNVRLELPIALESAGHSLDEVKEIISNELVGTEHVIKTIPPEIFLLSLTDKQMNLNIFIWINDVHKSKAIKSQLLNCVYEALNKKGIKVV